MDQTISKTESAILHTYNRYDLVLEKGDGAYLYDTDGKAYLDFGSGSVLLDMETKHCSLH